ncbi:hypothetical protein TRIATDRAFT_92626 [Trichoderma atroviride IMI 206040]|uniref:Uncharacterized protein n=1 Tax=Hypocrea atroviridis (strain ATCC 20476 / IMI 206040) TaxID=452589 RepID=G9NIH2_HYPAI|nr:uncharacterized protein TRIATDRAFT_92626 [Trichoderma atroviride IMI 206040]EHK49584.1 hypothetical protein TRIATDRAFT_92626 [Trichoderma atroviride IMI 206040]
MLPPKPQTQSTENLLLKCQKETHKKCLPPEWSIHPPNKEILPPHDTLALAIQIDSSSPSTRINFLEAASNRSVGSILGAEYRGSIVVVPWRPGLKFVCVATCRRRSGCRVGVVREAKRGAAAAASAQMKKDSAVAAAATVAAAKRSVGGGRNMGSDKALDVNHGHHAAVSPASSSGSPTRSRIPTPKGQRMSIKKYENNRHVSVNAARTIGTKSRIPTRRVVAQSCC